MNSREMCIKVALLCCTKRRSSIRELVCSYSLRGCWWPNCRWSQCILSEPAPQWLSQLSSAPCTLWDRGQRTGCSSTCSTEHKVTCTQSHMTKNKSFIHTCCDTKKCRYDGAFLFSLMLRQICSIKTITDCLCQGHGSCCAKCQHCFGGSGGAGDLAGQAEGAIKNEWDTLSDVPETQLNHWLFL